MRLPLSIERKENMDDEFQSSTRGFSCCGLIVPVPATSTLAYFNPLLEALVVAALSLPQDGRRCSRRFQSSTRGFSCCGGRDVHKNVHLIYDFNPLLEALVVAAPWDPRAIAESAKQFQSSTRGFSCCGLVASKSATASTAGISILYSRL